MKLKFFAVILLLAISIAAWPKPRESVRVQRANERVVAALKKNDYAQIRRGILAGATNWNTRVPGASPANTPLFWTARKNDAQSLRLLLSRGANVNTKGYGGATPLHTAAAVGAREVTLLLIERKAKLDAKEDYGKTPLHIAMMSFSWRPSEPVARLLIQHGADVNAQDVEGKSVLLYAVGQNAAPMVALLLRSGAKANLQDHYKLAPLHLAMEPDSRPQKLETSIAQLLLAHGAKVDIRDGDGKTPLFWAARRGQLALAQLLLDKGANVNAQTPSGGTPLLETALYGSFYPASPRMAALLLQRGANPNAKNQEGVTPLSVARQKGLEGIATALVAAGAKD